MMIRYNYQQQALGKGNKMNSNKSRGVIAGVAVAVLGTASFVGADLLGHAMNGAEYRYELAVPVIAVSIAVGVLLFAWNVVTYKGVK
jgi:hypothetical protein